MMKSPLFIESRTNTINLSDDDTFSPILEPLFKYMYSIPIEIPDCNIGLLWSGMWFISVFYFIQHFIIFK